MIKIHRPKKASKRSGFELMAGDTTTLRGVTIVNHNAFSLFIDKFTPKKKKTKKIK